MWGAGTAQQPHPRGVVVAEGVLHTVHLDPHMVDADDVLGQPAPQRESS